jgi:hypothetical protein
MGKKEKARQRKLNAMKAKEDKMYARMLALSEKNEKVDKDK